MIKYFVIVAVFLGVLLFLLFSPEDFDMQGVPEPTAISWQDPVEVAAGDAYQGPWQGNESEFRYVDAPSAAIDDEGVVGVSFVKQSRKNVYFQVYEPDGEKRFSEPVNISRSPDKFSWLPRVVFSPNNTDEIYIVWQEIEFTGGSHGGEIYFARSTDGGRSFSEPLNLSNTPAGAGKGRLTRRYWDNGSLDIYKTNNGNIYIAWTEYEGPLRLTRSTDKGRTFAEPVHVAGVEGIPARGPALAADDNNNVYLAWSVGGGVAGDPMADIHIASSPDGGETFNEPRVILESKGHSDAPKLALDAEGTLHLAYAEDLPGPFDWYQIHYSRSRDGGKTFEEPRKVAAEQLSQYDSMNFPSLAVDDQNNVYLVWELYPDRTARPRGLGYAVSSDGGESFGSPAVVPGTDNPDLGVNGSLQGLLMRKLAVNNTGEIAVVNSTFRPNESSYVWLIRGNKTAQ